MIDLIANTVGWYLDYYVDSVVYFGRHLSPTKYAIVLFSVALVGWLLMHNRMKR